MKNYTWAPGYKYINVPVYLIHFKFLFWWIRLVKTGYKRRRVGIKITKPDIWELYTQLLTPARKRRVVIR